MAECTCALIATSVGLICMASTGASGNDNPVYAAFQQSATVRFHQDADPLCAFDEQRMMAVVVDALENKCGITVVESGTDSNAYLMVYLVQDQSSCGGSYVLDFTRKADLGVLYDFGVPKATQHPIRLRTYTGTAVFDAPFKPSIHSQIEGFLVNNIVDFCGDQ